MDILLSLKVPILGVVEDLTEFLPISGTGHLIILDDLLNLHNNGRVFEIAIQLGTVLVVILEYRQRFADIISGLGRDRKANRFMLNLVVVFVPVAVVGPLLNKQIKLYLFNPITVVAMLVLGGFFILWMEEHQNKKKPKVANVDDIRPIDALVVGCTQICAPVPGTPRSGSTTMGDTLWGLERKTATELSLFLAVPMMIAATGYDVLKHYRPFTTQNVGLIAVGFVAAFLAGPLTVKALLKFVVSKSYAPFVYYRIVFGGLILFAWAMGWVDWAEQRRGKLKRGRLKRNVQKPKIPFQTALVYPVALFDDFGKHGLFVFTLERGKVFLYVPVGGKVAAFRLLRPRADLSEFFDRIVLAQPNHYRAAAIDVDGRDVPALSRLVIDRVGL